jgi:hypothetical protein
VPIKVVVVSGTNYDVGVQYGEQAAELIAVNRDVVWNILETKVPVDRSVIEKDIQVWTYYQKKCEREFCNLPYSAEFLSSQQESPY